MGLGQQQLTDPEDALVDAESESAHEIVSALRVAAYQPFG